jgi:hypothetical protein
LRQDEHGTDCESKAKRSDSRTNRRCARARQANCDYRKRRHDDDGFGRSEF